MLYNTRRGPDFEASQWFKNGDHPEDYAQNVEGLENGEPRTWTGQEAKEMKWEGQIVRYFRHPDPRYAGDKACPICGKLYHDHGWIEEDKLYKVHGSELITQITFGELSPEGAVCPGDFISTFYQFGEKGMAGSKPEMVKKYVITPERHFHKFYVAVDNV
jgi:hypothetical protein